MAGKRSFEQDDLVHTISDNDSITDEDAMSESEHESTTGGKKRKSTKAQAPRKRQKSEVDVTDDARPADEFEPGFQFEVEDGLAAIDDFDAWAAPVKDLPVGRDIVEIVASRRSQVETNDDEEKESMGEDDVQDDDDDDDLLADDAFGMQVDDADDSDANSDQEHSQEEEEDDDDDDHDHGQKPSERWLHPADINGNAHSDDDDEQDTLEEEKRTAFFEPETSTVANNALPTDSKSTSTFVDMKLCRPILKGLAAANLTNTTPIQHRAIPVALTGKDVVGSAVTGSGKTAAFVVPILERLVYRDRQSTKSRVVILLPTRELALQCYAVATKLASFTDITFAQAIGGLNQKEQERALRLRPDIIIATPGRFIDFMRNSSAMATDAVEILVLDEADRMLEDGFADELNEILTTIPKSRQTMLFSATMTSSVDNLVRIGMTRPVRLMVDAPKQTVSGLTQEFVRLRPGREEFRLGYLLYLCTTSYTSRTIIFFRQKAFAHRVRVIFAVLGLSAAELHGAMTQDQRMRSMSTFRSGSAKFLLATDLASRGLDIPNVEAVINYEAPQSHEIYLHRVGRTARAGKTGKACTLAAEGDRRVVKQAAKTARKQGAIIKSRIIPPDEAEEWQTRLDGLEEEIEAVLKEEKEEKVLVQTEMQMQRADNIMTHEKEILARPKKTWFQGQKEKAAASEKGRLALNAASSGGRTSAHTGAAASGDSGVKDKKQPKRKLSNKQRKKLDDKDERRDMRSFQKTKVDRGAVRKPAVKTKGKANDKKKGGKPRSKKA